MDVFGRELSVGNVAGDHADRLIKAKGRKSAEYVDAVAGTSVFVPLVSGAGKPVTGLPFDLTGSKVPVQNGVIQGLKKATGFLDQLPGPEPAKKELTAAWIEVEVTAPGTAPLVARRDLLRKGSKGRQRVFDLLSTREILVLPGEVSTDFALDLLLESDIAAKDALLQQISPKALVAERHPARLNPKLYQFALAQAAARAKKATPAPARPTLVSFVHRILEGKPVRIRAGFDILVNPPPPVAAKPASWRESVSLAAGLRDTALEHELHKSKGAHANTSVQLEKAIAEKAALKVEKSGDRLRVVVPGKPGSWYEVDPKTGGCLGYVDEGGGQDMTEYAMLVADKLEEIREWQSHAELLNDVLDCAMQAIDAADSETAFAHCLAGVAIGEAFGWAAGGIIGGAAEAAGTPWARFAGMGLEDWLNDTLGDAMDGAMGGGR
jgi:hypothetical protein